MPTRSSIVATSPVADATPVTYSMHTGQLWLETGQQSATRVSRSTIVATSPVADATPVTYSIHTGQLWLETGRLTSQQSATRVSNCVQIGQLRAHTGHMISIYGSLPGAPRSSVACSPVSYGCTPVTPHRSEKETDCLFCTHRSRRDARRSPDESAFCTC